MNYIRGRIIVLGTVDEHTEPLPVGMTRVVIETTEQELKQLTHNMLYREVIVALTYRTESAKLEDPP